MGFGRRWKNWGGFGNVRAPRFRPGDWVIARKDSVTCGIGQVQDVQLIEEDGTQGYVYVLEMQTRRCSGSVFFESELHFYGR
jgi:hypothetical protein